MKKYDYLIVGAGLFGATFARLATDAGRRCLVIDRRAHTGGNLYCESVKGINVHKYGAHIFHTSDRQVWEFVNSIVPFNRYTNSPVASAPDGRLYNLPFNMNTFYQMWGVRTPAEALARLEEQRADARRQMEQDGVTEPRNLEEQALALIGRDIYEKLIKCYTEKQWGRPCTELPAFIIRRLPVRLTFDNNYFNDRYQGIPVGGYTPMVAKMLDGAEVLLGTDYFSDRAKFDSLADTVVYTGAIDALFGYGSGKLEYRTLRFETEVLDVDNFQGNAVVNYTSHEAPYTRIIEHKHFEFGGQPKTVITREYSKPWEEGDEPYYPVNDEKNNALASKYREMAERAGYILGGRLADYRYYDMDKVIENALLLAERIIK